MEESRALIPRLLRTAGLEPDAFDHIAADREATPQAGLVVLLAGVGASLGLLLSGRGAGSLIAGTAGGLVTWLVWSWFAYAAGVLLFQGSADYGRLLRPIGFAYGPLMLRTLRFLPGIGGVLWEAAALWALFAGVVAVRQAFRFSTPRAVATMAAGWLLQRAVFHVLSSLLGPFPLW